MTKQMSLYEAREKVAALAREVRKRIVGMDEVFNLTCVCLFAQGHMLLEGVPGLAKTLFFKTMAEAMSVEFRRISFAADLLPKDVVGIEDFDRETGKVRLVVRGPLHTNFLLCDELNRARTTSKGSVLEPMEEGQVTTELGGTYKIAQPFMVMATQNPVEEEGVFALGRAEQDRFLMKVVIGYPSDEDETEIVARYSESPENAPVTSVMSREDILAVRETIATCVHVDPEIIQKVQTIVRQTRPEYSDFEDVKRKLQIPGGGASPRAGIYIVRAARVHAALRGGDYVDPQDISVVVTPILRHRLMFKPGEVEENEAEETLQKLVETILDKVL